MTLRERILEALADGPHTAGELAELLGITTNQASACLSVLRKKRKLVHICEWRREMVGGRLYPRAVFAAGEGANRRRPPRLTPTQYAQRYRQRCRGAVSSVFQLGLAIDNRRVPMDWRTL